MYDFIKGKLIEITHSHTVLEANGIGYFLRTSLSCYSHLSTREGDIQLFVASVIREDTFDLYGFPTKEERELFQMIREVSGIGPKTALLFIGHMGPKEFENAILRADSLLLSKIPGVGKKTAERLIIELRDKLHKKSGSQTPPSFSKKAPSSYDDAIRALVNLGYQEPKAKRAVEKALLFFEKNGSVDLAELVTASLKSQVV